MSAGLLSAGFLSAGLLSWTRLSVTHEQMFSMDGTSEDIGQDSNRMSCVSRKTRTRRATNDIYTIFLEDGDCQASNVWHNYRA